MTTLVPTESPRAAVPDGLRRLTLSRRRRATDMAVKVAQLTDEDNVRSEMGRQARRLIESRYSAPLAAKEHLSHFESLHRG